MVIRQLCVLAGLRVVCRVGGEVNNHAGHLSIVVVLAVGWRGVEADLHGGGHRAPLPRLDHYAGLLLGGWVRGGTECVSVGVARLWV